ncbi:MAG: nucleotidyltransferase domain-containing protein [Ignavibacteriae bacterium]|nr:nucleotidyltransferase domain-containing protein [Ignavibacteriota bacterium]
MLDNKAIEKIREYFSKHPVEKVYLFGSYARSEQDDESDIDLLLEFNKDARIGLIQFSRIKIDIEKALKHKVDLLTKESVSPYINPNIQKDIIKIYEKSN